MTAASGRSTLAIGSIGGLRETRNDLRVRDVDIQHQTHQTLTFSDHRTVEFMPHREFLGVYADKRALKRYLVVIRLASPRQEEAQLTRIQSVLRQLARKGEVGVAFTSHDGTTFGALINARKSSSEIRGAVEGGPQDGRGSPIPRSDDVLVFGLSGAFDANGSSRNKVAAWLERHEPQPATESAEGPCCKL